MTHLKRDLNKIQKNFDPSKQSQKRIIGPSFDPKKYPKNRYFKLKFEPIKESKQETEKNPVKTEEIQNKSENCINKPKHEPKKRELHILYNDGKEKECGRCHEIKSLNKFEKYMRSRKTAYCKLCRLEYKQIRALQNKTNIIRNIYGGDYAEKCPECNTTIAKLPAFDFHHPIKELKTKEINFHGNWLNTLKRLEKEKALPSCRKCHLKKQAKYYNKYKDLIEQKNDFEAKLEGIEKKLYNIIYKKAPDKKYREGYQIKSWISKRIVIERLYNGKCIGCGERNLAALQFHHRDITKKTFQKYDTLRYTTIEKIEKKLIQDDAVCLCGNCHRMIGAYYFEKNHQEIVGTKYTQEITKFYKELKNHIKNFKFPGSILKQYPFLKTEKIEIGWKPKSYKLKPDEQGIKEEVKSINWEAISLNWKLPTGEILDPTKECSRTNPLYKHKNWLEYIYNNNKWRLTDEKIARITNTSQTTINSWRKKLQIKTRDTQVKQKLFFDGKNKECGLCHQVKPATQFTWRRKNGKSYPISVCKSCSKEQTPQVKKKDS